MSISSKREHRVYWDKTLSQIAFATPTAGIDIGAGDGGIDRLADTAAEKALTPDD